MFSDFFRKYILPTVVLSGGMIGVGFLSLPHVALKAGIWITMVYFVVLAFVVLSINIIFAKISLQTPDFKRFPGFVGYYLGKWGGLTAFITSILGYLGVLLVYLIIGGEFLNSALHSVLGGSSVIYTLLYFVLATVVVFFGIKIISRVELLSVSLLLLSIVLIAIKGFWDIKLGNVFSTPLNEQLSNIFIPYGPILFAMWGIGIIPEVEEMMRGNKKMISKVITAGTLIPVLIYVLFTILILSITGSATTESALTGLNNPILLLIGAMVTFVAFIVQALTFKKSLIYDLKIKESHALVISCFTPLVLFLLGMKSFVPLVSFIGGVLLSIDGVLILLMYKKIGGKKIVILPLVIIFILGIIYEIAYFIK